MRIFFELNDNIRFAINLDVLIADFGI